MPPHMYCSYIYASTLQRRIFDLMKICNVQIQPYSKCRATNSILWDSFPLATKPMHINDESSRLLLKMGSMCLVSVVAEWMKVPVQHLTTDQEVKQIAHSCLETEQCHRLEQQVAKRESQSEWRLFIERNRWFGIPWMISSPRTFGRSERDAHYFHGMDNCMKEASTADWSLSSTTRDVPPIADRYSLLERWWSLF